MPDLSIAHASLDDLEQVAPLFDAYRVFYHQLSNLPATRAYLHARMVRRESVLLLARQSDQAVGFVQLYPGFSSIDLRHQWTLEDLYVNPAARRQGIAARLMQAARQHALESGAVRLVLSTAHDNHEAQALYQRLGYQRDDVYLNFALELDY